MYNKLPKVELHIHLDCSLSYDVVALLIPGISIEEYQNKFTAPKNCCSLNDYIDRAQASINYMQTKEQLRIVTLDLLAQFDADNVIYAEIRFAPLQHLAGGLSAEEVVQEVLNAIHEAKAINRVEANVILCTLRHYSEQQSMTTIKLVERFKGKGVVGFDIAADEAGYPLDNHVSAFKFAKSNDILCTAHTGEALGPKSVWETLEKLSPNRIGHGIRSIEDASLIERLIESNIHLEVCPTSNQLTRVYPSLEEYPIHTLYKTGVSMSISTDGRAISAVDLNQEYQFMTNQYGWTINDLYRINTEAIKHSFATEEVKMAVQAKLDAFYLV
jgi:adenosine deaminase